MDEAFIYLLKSPRNYYFFDVNKNTLLNINKEVYEYLASKKDANANDLVRD